MHPHPRRPSARTALPLTALSLTALALGAGAVVVAAPAAHAAPDCGRAPVQYSVDGGAHWTAGATMPAESAVVQVRLAGVPAAGCDYHVSLGSYETQGPTWATSGRQAFLGWATVTLTREHYRDTLDVTGHLPHCYGELALYTVGEKYDGSDSDHPLPHYPDEPFSGLAVATWNGGTACTPEPTAGPATPTAPAPTTAAPTTAAPTTAAPAPVPSPTGPATPSRTPTPTAAPTLAATGPDDGLLTAAAVAAALLLAAGGAAAYAARRR
ncbi:hypothetical protein [Kitasatospora sp. NPDC096140]|uniref:hypothetical protein n=1 Tax=unclassified Kitasatospora TaxID=2633591 RepID=UPI00331697ED